MSNRKKQRGPKDKRDGGNQNNMNYNKHKNDNND